MKHERTAIDQIAIPLAGEPPYWDQDDLVLTTRYFPDMKIEYPKTKPEDATPYADLGHQLGLKPQDLKHAVATQRAKLAKSEGLVSFQCNHQTDEFTSLHVAFEATPSTGKNRAESKDEPVTYNPGTQPISKADVQAAISDTRPVMDFCTTPADQQSEIERMLSLPYGSIKRARTLREQ